MESTCRYKIGQTLYFFSEYGYLHTTKVVYVCDQYIATQVSANADWVFIYPKDFSNYYTGISQIPTEKLTNPYLTR